VQRPRLLIQVSSSVGYGESSWPNAPVIVILVGRTKRSVLVNVLAGTSLESGARHLDFYPRKYEGGKRMPLAGSLTFDAGMR
jgi:hypothetical protein